VSRRRPRSAAVLAVLAALLAGCSRGAPEVERDLADTITVTSTAMTEGGAIPARFIDQAATARGRLTATFAK
jgi:hypothetical protein